MHSKFMNKFNQMSNDKNDVYICLCWVSTQPPMQNVQMAVTSTQICCHVLNKGIKIKMYLACNAAYFKYANKLLTNMPLCCIGTCLPCFGKQCIKIFVKGGPGILSPLPVITKSIIFLLLPIGIFIRISL